MCRGSVGGRVGVRHWGVLLVVLVLALPACGVARLDCGFSLALFFISSSSRSLSIVYCLA